MIKIGLTGGIGVGKSTLCEILKEWGAEIVNCDELAHQSLKKDGENYKTVVDHFGPEILDDSGEINRGKLGKIVFADTEQLKRLNDLCHGVVRKMWQNQMTEWERLGRKVIVVEIPLLFEIDAESDFDRTIVLGSSRDVQVSRLLARGYDRDSIDQRIDSMWPLEKKMKFADYVIWNDRNFANLRRQAMAIMYHICLGGEAETTLL